MRGDDRQQAAMLSYPSPEQRVPVDHPLRPIRQMVDDVLRGLSLQFDALYARTGRPSIPPEKLLRALLAPLLYSVRSERQLMEQLDYHLLFRWFVGLNLDHPVWDATVFTKNRERLLAGDIAQGFFDHVLAQAYARDLMSVEHFSVDGTLLKAWASQKSFQPKPEAPAPADEPSPADEPPPVSPGRNPEADFRGQVRRNDTHQSTTEPEARLYRKGSGQPAELSYLGHVLMENRTGLDVQATVTPATGTAEREAALAMVPALSGAGPKTLAADRAYDTQAFVADLRALGATPHVSQHTTGRRSAIDGRTTRHPGYRLSLQVRKRIEEIVGPQPRVSAVMDQLSHLWPPGFSWSQPPAVRPRPGAAAASRRQLRCPEPLSRPQTFVLISGGTGQHSASLDTLPTRSAERSHSPAGGRANASPAVRWNALLARALGITRPEGGPSLLASPLEGRDGAVRD